MQIQIQWVQIQVQIHIPIQIQIRFRFRSRCLAPEVLRERLARVGPLHLELITLATDPRTRMIARLAPLRSDFARAGVGPDGLCIFEVRAPPPICACMIHT